MLTLIRNHKTSKWISGIMLAGLTMSLPVSCFKLTTDVLKTAALPPRPKTKMVSTKPEKVKHAETEYATDSEKQAIKTSDENAQQLVQEVKTPVKTSNIPVSNAVTVTRNKQSSSVINRNAPAQKDTYLLARVIHAEARGEPLEGQVAVGAVLLNRLHDARFPKTLSQIIFKRGEFCTVRDGQIWMTPNQQAIKAARLAVSGWDPTNGAVYFYNPGKTTSRWIWSRPIVHKIGRHYFAV